MSSADNSQNKTNESDESDAIQQARVVPAENVPEPNVKKWQPDNLSQLEEKKEDKVRSDVMAQIRKEVAPQLIEQTSLIKKNAFEEAHKKGYEDGFKQGVKAGKLEGKSQANKEATAALEPQVKSLQDLAEFMCTPYQEISEEVFKNLAHIVIKMADKLVRNNIEQDEEWILEILKVAVAKFPNETETIKISLHPSDMELIKKYATDNSKNWQLIADPSLELGCCSIKQNSSTLTENWQKDLDKMMKDALGLSQNIVSVDSPQDTV